MFRIYYTDPVDNKAYAWDEDTLTGALSSSETFRKRGMIFVTTVSENIDMVGKSGVDSIENGLCPDGVEYSWRKRR